MLKLGNKLSSEEHDPSMHIEEIRKLAEAGYDHIWIHQIGPEQDGFLDFYADRVLPKLA